VNIAFSGTQNFQGISSEYLGGWVGGLGFNVNIAFFGTQNLQGISSEDQLLDLGGGGDGVVCRLWSCMRITLFNFSPSPPPPTFSTLPLHSVQLW